MDLRGPGSMLKGRGVGKKKDIIADRVLVFYAATLDSILGTAMIPSRHMKSDP